MHDKVVGLIRETLLHENTIESLSIGLAKGEVRLLLLQPNEKSSWPDHELMLTFSGVRELFVRSIDEACACETILSMECEIVERGYRARITVGDSNVPSRAIELGFSDLRFKRS